jgi:hypothetical protein
VEEVPTLLVEYDKFKDPTDMTIYILYTGNFPDRLKIAVVKPIYKIGNKTIWILQDYIIINGPF